MKRLFAVSLLAFAAGASLSCLRRPEAPPTASAPPPEPAQLVGATLLEGLGNHHFPITTSKSEAQRWFDQALMLTYGFNHDAAERSYLRATQLDPDCAMCWWGAALVLGPHVNAAMDPANNAPAWQRLQKAIAACNDLSRAPLQRAAAG